MLQIHWTASYQVQTKNFSPSQLDIEKSEIVYFYLSTLQNLCNMFFSKQFSWGFFYPFYKCPFLSDFNYKENIDNILKDFDIADVWGVGRQLSKLYIKNGIDNAYKLKNISNTWVKKSTNVLGAKTVMELRGIPCIDLETEETRRKSCCVSRSFGKKVESLDKLKESITTHCLNAAEKIRTDKQTTRAVTIFIRTSPFDKNRKYYSNSITMELPVATNNSIELVKTAISGLGKIYKYGYFYQKAGVILSKLRDASEKELNLLAPILENKSQPLMRAIDFTNAKYGRNAISIAQAGISNDWKMRREHSSRIDTASFDFLPKINI